MRAGSICGRAGRFFRRMIFLIFFSIGAATSSLVVVSASSCDSSATGVPIVSGSVSTSAMIIVNECATGS